MPVDPDSKLIVKAAKLLRDAPLDSELKLLLIELVVRMEDNRLEELLKLVEEYIIDSEKDNTQLKASLKQIKAKHDKKVNLLVGETEQQLMKLEGEISEEEKEGKIEEVKKKIKES